MGPADSSQPPRRCGCRDLSTAPSRRLITANEGRPTVLFRLLLQAQEGAVTQDEVLAADFESAQRGYLSRIREHALAARILERVGCRARDTSTAASTAVAAHHSSPLLPAATAPTAATPQRLLPGTRLTPASTEVPLRAHPTAGDLALQASALPPASGSADAVAPPTASTGLKPAKRRYLGTRAMALASASAAAVAEATEVAEASRRAGRVPGEDAGRERDWQGSPLLLPPPPQQQQQQQPPVVLMQAVPVITIDASVRPPKSAAAIAAAWRGQPAAAAADASQPPLEHPLLTTSWTPAAAASQPAAARQPSRQSQPRQPRLAAAAVAGSPSSIPGQQENPYDFDEQLLAGFWPPRRLAARLCSHPDFELLVVLLILANTVALALYRPKETDGSVWNRHLFWAEMTANALFTVEMLLRMLALGGALPYLRHPWNIFDGGMVVVGYVALVPTGSSSSSGGLRALRALRALRPLRTITRFESLRAVVVCFLEAVPLLGSAVGLMLLFMLVFAVAGTILFAGVYHRKCYADAEGTLPLALLVPEEAAQDPDMLGCGGWRSCPANYTCRVTSQSDALNIAGFSNTGLSLLTVFQCITLTGWSFAMYRTIYDTNPAAAVYYVLLVSIGAYVLVNLFLAVLKIKFAKAQTAFRARNSGRSPTRRNSVVSLLVKAKSRLTEFSARRSASNTFNTSIAHLVTARLSQFSESNVSLADDTATTTTTAAAAPTSGTTPHAHPNPHSLQPQSSKLPQARPQREKQLGTTDVIGGGGSSGAPCGGDRRGSDATTLRGDTAAAEGLVNSRRRNSDEPSRRESILSNGRGGGSNGSNGRRRSVSSSVAGGSSGSSGNLVQLDPRVGGEGLGAFAAALPKESPLPRGGAASSRARRLSAPVLQNLLGPAAAAASRCLRFESIGHRLLPSLPPPQGPTTEARVAAAPAKLTAVAAVAEGTEVAEAADMNIESTPAARDVTLYSSATPDRRRFSGGVNNNSGDGGGDATETGMIASGGASLTSPSGVRFGQDEPQRTASAAAIAKAFRVRSPPRQLTADLRNHAQRQESRTRRVSRNAVVPLPLAAAAVSPAASPLQRPALLQPSPLPRSALRNAGGCGGGGAAAAAAAAAANGGSFSRARTATGLRQPAAAAAAAACYAVSGIPSGLPADPQLLMGANLAMAALMMDPAEFDEFVASEPPLRRLRLRAMFRTRVLVESQTFSHVMLVIIFVNTVALAMEYDGMSASYEAALVKADYVFTALFTTEMALKLFGMGVWDYVKDGLNVFDALIVTASWLEIILSLVGSDGSLSAMAALRAVRTLRLLKALRHLASLRKIAAKLLASFSSFAAVAVLIGLFWGVFAIVGLHVFGNLPLDREPYPNFDTFMNSLVTTFNILTLENYQKNMYETIRATNYGSAVFFVAWIVVGKYILLTLFLAVTLEAFEAKYDVQSASSSWMSKMRSAMESAVGSVLGSVRRTSLGDGRKSSSSSLVDSWVSLEGPTTPTKTDNDSNHHRHTNGKRQRNGPDTNAVAVGDVDAAAAAATKADVTTRDRSSAGGGGGDAAAAATAAAAAARPYGYIDVFDAVTAGPALEDTAQLNLDAADEAATAVGYDVSDDKRRRCHSSSGVGELDVAAAVPGGFVRGDANSSKTPRYDRASGVVWVYDKDSGSDDDGGPGGQPATRTRMPGGPVAENTEHQQRLLGRTAADGYDVDAGAVVRSRDAANPPGGLAAPALLELSPMSSPDYDTSPPPSPFVHLTAAAAGAATAATAPPSCTTSAPASMFESLLSAWASTPSDRAAGAGGVGGGGAGLVHVQMAQLQRGATLPGTTVRKDLARSISAASPAWPQSGVRGAADSSAVAASTGGGSGVRAASTSKGDDGTDARRGIGSGAAAEAPSSSDRMSCGSSGSGTSADARRGPSGSWSHDHLASSSRLPGPIAAVAATPVPAPAAAAVEGTSGSSSGSGTSAATPTAALTATTRPARYLGTNGNDEPLLASIALAEDDLVDEPPPTAAAAMAAAALPPRRCLEQRLSAVVAAVADAASPGPDGGGGGGSRGNSGGSGGGNTEGLPKDPDDDPMNTDGDRYRRRRTRTHVSIDLPPEVEDADGGGGGGGSAARQGCISTGSLNSPAGGALGGSGQDGRRSRDVSAVNALDPPVDGRSSGSWLESTSPSAQPDVRGSGNFGGPESRPTGRTRHRAGHIPLAGKVLFLVGPDNSLRRRVYRLVVSKPFEYSLFFTIVVNCGMMTLEGPSVEYDSQLGLALFWGNAACTGLFTLELLAKVFAWTFRDYIRDITNQVDFLVVITGLLDLALTTSGTQAVSALRVLRVLKPLRLLTRSAGMRLVFKSVVLSLGAMAHVSLLCVMFLIIFAILGVQLFSGKLYSCNDGSVSGRSACIGSFVDPATGATLERSWDNIWPNFDNVGNALLACFVVSSLNGYSELMTATMAAPAEKGQQPTLNANPGAFFWYVGFTLVVPFTLLNLYVGVIFAQFSRIRNMSTTGSAFLTSKQQEWVEMSKMVFRLRPPEKGALPRGRLRLPARRLAQSTGLERVMLVVIVANVAVLAATWYGQPAVVDDVQGKLNIAFTAVYAAEAALKLYGLGVRLYWDDPWNKFDLAVVVAGLVEVVLSFLVLNTGYARVLRVFRLQRLLRVTRLVRKSKGIQTLFQALVMSLPAFGNVGALIGLLFFMYAYTGVLLFGRVRRDDVTSAINSAANFANFGAALSALLRVATGDNWTDLMYGCMVQPPDCSRAAGDCGTWLAVPYFLSCFLLIAIIMLNLFTAVIIENFEKTHEQDEWRLTPQNLEDFVMLWAEYDDGSGTISPAALEQLLLRLDPPLGLGPYADNKEVLRFVYDLDIPLVGGRVPFHKTAFELVKRISKTDIPDGQLKAQLDELAEAFFRDLASPHQDDQMHFTVAFSVMLIQRRWRFRYRTNRLRKKRAWRESRQETPPYNALVDAPGPQRLAEALVRAAAAAAAEPAGGAAAAAVANLAAAARSPPLAPPAPPAGALGDVSVAGAKARPWTWSNGGSSCPMPDMSYRGVTLPATATATAATAGGNARISPAVPTLRWRFNPNLVPPGLAAAVADATAAAAAASRKQQQQQQQQQQQRQAPLLPWSPLRGLEFLAKQLSSNLGGEAKTHQGGGAQLAPPPPVQRISSGTDRSLGLVRHFLGPSGGGMTVGRQRSIRPRAWAAISDGGVATSAAGAGGGVEAGSVRTMPTIGGAPPDEQCAGEPTRKPLADGGGGGGGGDGSSGLWRSVRSYFRQERRGPAAAPSEEPYSGAGTGGDGGSDGVKGSSGVRAPMAMSPSWRSAASVQASAAAAALEGSDESTAAEAEAAAAQQRKFRAMMDFVRAAGALASGGDESFSSRRSVDSFGGGGGGRGGGSGSARPSFSSSVASDTSDALLGGRRRCDGVSGGGGGGGGGASFKLPCSSGSAAAAYGADGSDGDRGGGGGGGSGDSDGGSEGRGKWGPRPLLSIIAEEGGGGGGSGKASGGSGDGSGGGSSSGSVSGNTAAAQLPAPARRAGRVVA